MFFIQFLLQNRPFLKFKMELKKRAAIKNKNNKNFENKTHRYYTVDAFVGVYSMETDEVNEMGYNISIHPFVLHEQLMSNEDALRTSLIIRYGSYAKDAVSTSHPTLFNTSRDYRVHRDYRISVKRIRKNMDLEESLISRILLKSFKLYTFYDFRLF